MSEAPACDSPTGQPLVRAENGGKITREKGRKKDSKEPEKMREGGKGGGKDGGIDSLCFTTQRMRGEIGKSPLRRTLSEDHCSGLALPISPPLSTHLSSVSNNLYPRRPSFPQHSSQCHTAALLEVVGKGDTLKSSFISFFLISVTLCTDQREK